MVGRRFTWEWLRNCRVEGCWCFIWNEDHTRAVPPEIYSQTLRPPHPATAPSLAEVFFHIEFSLVWSGSLSVGSCCRKVRKLLVLRLFQLNILLWLICKIIAKKKKCGFVFNNMLRGRLSQLQLVLLFEFSTQPFYNWALAQVHLVIAVSLLSLRTWRNGLHRCCDGIQPAWRVHFQMQVPLMQSVPVINSLNEYRLSKCLLKAFETRKSSWSGCVWLEWF